MPVVQPVLHDRVNSLDHRACGRDVEEPPTLLFQKSDVIISNGEMPPYDTEIFGGIFDHSADDGIGGVGDICLEEGVVFGFETIFEGAGNGCGSCPWRSVVDDAAC